MVNTICFRYINCFLMMDSYCIQNTSRIDYWNKLRKKSASCWSVFTQVYHDARSTESEKYIRCGAALVQVGHVWRVRVCYSILHQTSITVEPH
jgi:hypothetical protein